MLEKPGAAALPARSCCGANIPSLRGASPALPSGTAPQSNGTVLGVSGVGKCGSSQDGMREHPEWHRYVGAAWTAQKWGISLEMAQE